ncbi:hypothetical protein AB5I41_09035 [Sphingomonas sp. MMS24-JH45]
MIQLHGSAREYLLKVVDDDTEIYVIGGRQPELIGIVANVTGLDLLHCRRSTMSPPATTRDPSDPPVTAGFAAGRAQAQAAGRAGRAARRIGRLITAKPADSR